MAPEVVSVGVQGGRGGVDASAVASASVSPVFLQGIGHIIPLQSTSSGTLNGEHPAQAGHQEP